MAKNPLKTFVLYGVLRFNKYVNLNLYYFICSSYVFQSFLEPFSSYGIFQVKGPFCELEIFFFNIEKITTVEKKCNKFKELISNNCLNLKKIKQQKQKFLYLGLRCLNVFLNFGRDLIESIILDFAQSKLSHKL